VVKIVCGNTLTAGRRGKTGWEDQRKRFRMVGAAIVRDRRSIVESIFLTVGDVDPSSAMCEFVL